MDTGSLVLPDKPLGGLSEYRPWPGLGSARRATKKTSTGPLWELRDTCLKNKDTFPPRPVWAGEGRGEARSEDALNVASVPRWTSVSD